MSDRRPRPARPTRDDERGAALVLVLVVLLMMAALAAEIALTARTQHQLSKHSMHEFLLRTAVDGRIHILESLLRFDATSDQSIDTEDDVWAYSHHEEYSSWGEAGKAAGFETSDEGFSYDNREVQLEAWVEDERSKLNLRGLSRPEGSNEFRYTREALIRLIDLYREEWSDLDVGESEAEEMVDELVDWLRDQADEEENPIPRVRANRGRLQCVDDLLRVPGKIWTRERLYDARDPEWDYEEEDQDELDPEDVPVESARGDGKWRRANGVPGLVEFITVQAATGDNPELSINVNTASVIVLKALFDHDDDLLAENLVDARREGSDDPDSQEEDVGYFRSREDLDRVDGFEGGDLASRHPRFNHFFATTSNVFSLRIIAKMVVLRADVQEEYDPGEEPPPDAPRDIVASYQYRRVVERTAQGESMITLFTQRRRDPIFER